MAGSKSLYLSNKLLNLMLGSTAYSVPATLYVGLWTDSNTLVDASDGSTSGEVSGGSYARVAITNDTTTWGAATTDGTRKNKIAITFATSSGSWGTIEQVAILDASTAGNILWWSDLSVPKSITNGDTPKIEIDNLIFVDN